MDEPLDRSRTSSQFLPPFLTQTNACAFSSH
jgi:hypothetical protein